MITAPLITAPYPYGDWPEISKNEVAIRRKCARRMPRVRWEEVRAGLLELAGAESIIEQGFIQYCPPDDMHRMTQEALVAAVLVAPGDGATRLAVELEPRLAVHLVDRILGGDGLSETPMGPIEETECGVLLFLGARLLATAQSHYRLATVLTTREALREAIGDDGAMLWSAHVQVGDQGGQVRVWFPKDHLCALALGAHSAQHLARLQLEFSACAGVAQLAQNELRELSAGDVVTLDESWWSKEREHSRIRVRAVGATRTTWWCTLNASESEIRVERVDTSHEISSLTGRRDSQTARKPGEREDAQPRPHIKEGAMDDHSESKTLLRVDDAPIDLAVEVARFKLSLAEVSDLRPGEVLATGRHIGERVTLRAGGQAIATGELVNVEGEIGVRLVEVGA